MQKLGLFFGVLAFACALSADAQDEIVGEIKQTNQTIVIDGIGDDAAWANAIEYNTENSDWFVNNGTVDDEEDLSASFKALWDDDNLYVYVQVTDDVIENSTECN